MKDNVLSAVLLISIIVVVLFGDLNQKESVKSRFFCLASTPPTMMWRTSRNWLTRSKSYMNFFGIGSTGIVWNFTKLDDICHMFTTANSYFMV